jgi:hypothetical protein
VSIRTEPVRRKKERKERGGDAMCPACLATAALAAAGAASAGGATALVVKALHRRRRAGTEMER